MMIALIGVSDPAANELVFGALFVVNETIQRERERERERERLSKEKETIRFKARKTAS